MAKTDKNNLQSRSNIYGTPTLTAEEFKAGANKLGEWFLNGMGAVGRFLNAGFTSPTYGTNGQVSYARNTEDAKRLRELSEALEQALAKGATYIMPANYIVGKGNPIKGEEKISLMEPWLLATIRGAELYFGPKAVKGVKNAPKTAVNTAAKAGSTVKKIVVDNKKLNINPNNLETFVDEYGRTITPTPWKGTDQSLIDLIAENLTEVLKDYFISPEKEALVKKTMKWGDKEYSEFLNELMRSIGTVADGQVKGPKDGFTIIALHNGKAVGEGSNMEGIHTMTFNRERIPDKKMAVEAIMHEIGGHGKTMSINPSKSSKISESFPRLTELMKKNLELADNILLLNNRGKFWSLFPNASDLELYLYNKGIHPKSTEQLFDQRRYFQYMTKDAQERAARAYTGLIMDKLGYDKTLNIKLLERYYTPESVEKYKNAVLNFGVPITGGYTLYNLLNNQSNNQLLEYRKQGGKMNILEFLKNGSGIHIKPSKRGSFTRWCGGNVTEECIRRGKNSPNAAIRKKATFADNAKHFKHKKGGKAFYNGVNILDSNPKMSKAASKRVKKHLYGGDINNPNAMGGTAFTSWLNYLLKLPELLKQLEEERKRKLELEQLETAQKTNTILNIIGSVGNFAMNKLGNLLNKSATKVDNGSPATTNNNFWDTPTIKNFQITGDFWNNPTIANSLV